MEKSLIPSIVLLMLINITDSITYSVVTPSLIFYVEEMGGTTEQYGVITSAAYVSGLVMTSFYGAWVDSNGHKYKAPYAASFAMGIVGSLIYFAAVAFPKGIASVGMILLGRLITGLGASGRSLAYSWVALAIPREEQRTTLTIMAMTRSLGLMLGPPLNLLVAKVNTEWVISSRLGLAVPVNPNNSVGLIVASMEAILFAAMFSFLVDPPEKEGIAVQGEKPAKKAGWREIFSACITNFELSFCPLNFFVVMANFTFYSVSIPPVGSHIFGWTPVQISNVLAAQAAMLFAGMCASMAISMTKAPDALLVGLGNLFFVVGGTMTYYWWTTDSTPLRFVAPILIVSLAFPFIGPATRSKYTKAIHSCPELEHSHGVMQGFMTQAIMIGGLVSPNFVTNFVLRSPEEIDAGGGPRELSPWIWYIPVSSMAVIIGLVYEILVLGEADLGLYVDEEGGITSDPDKARATEDSRLVGRSSSKRRRSSIIEINQNLSTRFEVDRRASCEAIGIVNPFETRDEMKLRELLLEDKKEWEELARLSSLSSVTGGMG